MIDALVFSLEWLLRIFGAFWMIGGAVTFHQALQASLMDSALEAITQEKEDRLVSRFLFVSALLTLLSGIGLALARRWVSSSSRFVDTIPVRIFCYPEKTVYPG